MAKRSFWAWGMEPDEPTAEQMKTAAGELSKRYKVNLPPAPPPKPPIFPYVSPASRLPLL